MQNVLLPVVLDHMYEDIVKFDKMLLRKMALEEADRLMDKIDQLRTGEKENIDEMGRKLLSVIVPVYNTEKELPECINSILAQTYGNIEIILVDDGSTDNSGVICDEYAEKYKNVIVKHQANLRTARKVGWKLAKGEYVGFVDCDDWLEPEMYEKLIKCLEKEQADMAVCAYNYVFEDGTVKAAWNQRMHSSYTREEAVEVIIEDYLIQNFVWNKVYKTDLWDAVGNETKYLGDFYQIANIMTKVTKVACINDCLYNYRQRTGSYMHRTNAVQQILYGYELFQTYMWRVEFWSLEFQQFRSRLIEQMIKQGLSLYHFMLLENFHGEEKTDLMKGMLRYGNELPKGKLYFRLKLIQAGFYESIYLFRKRKLGE